MQIPNVISNHKLIKRIPKNKFSEHPKAIFWSEKNVVPLTSVSLHNNQKYIFNCEKCPHQFKIAPSKICRGQWCSYCANQKLCEILNCEQCFNKSFASVEISKYWSSENKITPRMIFKHSNKDYFFDCPCGHNFPISPKEICSDGRWCPYCCNPPKKLCDNLNCKQCFEKSFASYEKSIFWSKNNIISPRMVFKFSHTVYLFDCTCGHTFPADPHNISVGNWCPYCANPPKKLCENLNCEQCFEKSFASHEKAKYLLSNINPRMIFKHSHTECSFLCEFCDNEYISRLDNVSHGEWCSCRKRKTETKLYNFLGLIYLNIEREKQFQWCKIKNKFPRFDFYIDNFKLIIELDGLQHFIYVKNWGDVKFIQEKDIMKMKLAINNNYSVIRISQIDVFNDKNDWQNKLKDAIKLYDPPTVTLIGDIYEKYPVFHNIFKDPDSR